LENQQETKGEFAEYESSETTREALSLIAAKDDIVRSNMKEFANIYELNGYFTPNLWVNEENQFHIKWTENNFHAGGFIDGEGNFKFLWIGSLGHTGGATFEYRLGPRRDGAPLWYQGDSARLWAIPGGYGSGAGLR
jgi:hypothetical protein